MNRGSVARLVTVALVWGSSFLWIKLALRGFSPGQIVLARLALGAVCLLIVCGFRRLASTPLWTVLFAMVAARLVAATGLTALTVEHGSTAASTVTYLLPIVSVLLGVAFLAEPLRWYAVAGMVVALVGVTLVRRAPRVAESGDLKAPSLRPG